MKGTPAIRIAVAALILVAAAAFGVLMYGWPTAEPPPPAPKSAARTPAPAPAPAPMKEAAEALKSLTDEVAPKKGPTDQAPAFDVARIEPNGEAVIGGRAAPGATVELLRGGTPHDQTVADPSGDFVLIPKTPLPPGNYDLTLRATNKDGKVAVSKDSVAVSLSAGREEKPVVALVEPDKPAVVLSKPTTDAATTLAIDAVEGEGGKLYVSGRAPSGARVHLYLNDAYIASAVASAEGRIAFSIQSGIKPGDYQVRLDQVDASGKVLARAEVPFKAPVMIAEVPAPKPDASAADAAKTDAAQPAAAPPKPDTSNQMAAAPAGLESDSAATPPTERTPQAAPPRPEPRETAVAPQATPEPPAPQPEPPAASTPAPREPETASADTSKPAAAPDNAQPRESAGGPSEPSSQPPSPAPQQTTTMASAPEPKDRKDVVVVPRVETTVVVRGDSLWRISRAKYGQGVRYSVIYKANRDQIRDPDLIYPGQIFVLPQSAPKP